jgi:hypothetical protein
MNPAVSESIRREQEKAERVGSRLLANALAVAPIGLGIDAYGRSSLFSKLDPKHQDAYDTLAKAIKDSGIKIFSESGYPASYVNKSIYMPGKNLPVGVLAHEWGHALNEEAIIKHLGKKANSLWNKLYGLGQSTAGPGLLGTMPAFISSLSDANEDTVRNLGLAGTALQLPMVAEELMASTRGALKLGKLKLPGKLRAFAGVPTYLASAAIPMLPWGLRKAEPKINYLLDKLKNKPSE